MYGLEFVTDSIINIYNSNLLMKLAVRDTSVIACVIECTSAMMSIRRAK